MPQWTVEHSAETTVAPEAVWRAWADVERWGAWNPDIEHVELRGPFATGSTILMTPRGADGPVELRIAEVVEGASFTDEADLGGTVLRTAHRIEASESGVRVVYAMEATGPAAAELGPAISADFPETIDGLLEYAAHEPARARP